jgi:hypothetical protein
MHEKRISQRDLVSDALPVLAVLLLTVGVTLYFVSVFGLWSRQCPDVVRTRKVERRNR